MSQRGGGKGKGKRGGQQGEQNTGRDHGDGGGRGQGRGDRGGRGRGRGDGSDRGRGRGRGADQGGGGGYGRGHGGEPIVSQPPQFAPPTPQPPSSVWGPPKQALQPQPSSDPPTPQPPSSVWAAPKQAPQPQPSSGPPSPQVQLTPEPQQVPEQQQPKEVAASQKQPKKGGKGKATPPAPKESPAKQTPSTSSIDSGGDGLKSQLKKAPGGTRGRKVDVYTNHFALSINKKLQNVYQYDVEIDPNRPKNQMRLVMEEFRRNMHPNIVAAFDGSKILFTTKALPNNGSLESTVKLTLDEREKEYKVAVKLANVVDMGQIAQFYEQVARGEIVDAPQITLQVIDVVLRHTLCLRQITVGRSLYSVPEGYTIRLGNGMHMYRGMFQSAILGGKPFLNVDVSNKAFPAALNLIDIIKDFGDERYPIDLQRKLRDDDLQRLAKFMRTLKVVYEIPRMPSSRRIYRVNTATSNAQDYTFKLDNGQTINVLDYFSREKKYRIMYPLMPLLHVGARDSKIFVPCELCTILPGQAVNRKCDADQTRVMIKECAKDTNFRKQGIMANVARARYNEDQVIREFGLSVSGDMEKVAARVLQPPVMQYQRSVAEVRKGVWNAQQFYQPAALRAGWTILCLERNVRPQEINNFIELAKRTAKSLGMSLDMVKEHTTLQLPPRRELQPLEQYFQQMKKLSVDLIVVILPRLDIIYNLVKKASEISVGCLTQCVKGFTFTRKMNEMTMRNILLKVNAKLNGANHIAKTPPAIMMRPTMLMGADVTHPPPDSENGFSVAAVTASCDPHGFRYNICWRLQEPAQEMIQDMESILREQLLFFYKATRNVKPEKIIMFRDGVSTGQFDAVLAYELMAIQRACAKLQADYRPQITFIVVQKRHHTRFFPVDARISEDRNLNVPAGTVVDKTIVHPSRQDFYMVSHASIQGVAKPTKYVTLWDDSNIDDDSMEELTYFLCHMFARCTRSVSYPAPTYYAHLAAARGKVYCDTQEINVKDLPKMQNQLVIKQEIVKDLPMFFV